jgi:hypothetical protein
MRFLNLKTGTEEETIWPYLVEEEIWRKARYENHESNTLKGAKDRTDWAPLIDGWIPIYNGQRWSNESSCFIDPPYSPKDGPGGIDDFLRASEFFLSEFDGRHIGVQLSGGLDSSLIIGLLSKFGISYSLIGLRSDRYEFRTERYIQELLANDCPGQVIMVEESDHLPCTGLDTVPPHQLPDLLSLNYSQDLAMALACKEAGIEVLFSGGGGDTLLGEAVPKKPGDVCWRPQTFLDEFPKDVVYASSGVEFLSFYEQSSILDAVFRLRKGKCDDFSKLWARSTFRDFLPSELVDYTYCADFWGRDIDGLLGNMAEIRELHARAHDISRNSYFADGNLEKLLAEDLLRPTKVLYQRIDSRISSAVWVCSLVKSLG